MGDAAHGIEFVPRTPAALIPRERLVAALDSAIRNPLIIVRAAGGAGKSTALAEWARTRTLPGVWVTLDRSASDRLGFWKRVTAAIANSGHLGVHSVLHDFVVAPESAPTIVSAVSTALALQSTPFTLVLDDFHEVADADIDADLHRLLHENDKLALVIGTRVLSSLESAEHRATVDTAVLTGADLAFSRREVEQLAGLFGHDAATGEALYDAFEGWPLPTRMTLLELANGHAADARDAIDRVRRSDGGLVLDGMDEDYAQFLLRSSLAGRLSPELAEQLGGPDATAHLARAERDGIGTWAARESGDAFVIHAHVRQQLERELFARMPHEVPALRNAAARDRLAHRDPLEAARQYAAAGDVEGVADVVRRHYGDISWGALTGVLRSMRPADLRRQPELLAVLVVADYADPTAPRARILNTASLVMALVQARIGLGSPVDRLGLLLGLLGVQRTGGHYDEAVATAERLVAIADSLDEQSRRRVAGVLPTVWSQSAACYFYADQSERAEALFRRGAETARATDQSWRELYATGMLSLVMATRGDITALRARLDREQQRRRPHGWEGTYIAAGHHLARAFVAIEDFDTDAARAELDLLAPHEVTIEHWPLIAHLRAIAALVDETPSLGLESLSADIAAHSHRPPTSRAMTALLDSTRANLLLAAGRPERARDALRSSRRHRFAILARARAELALGHDSDAIALASPLALSEKPGPRARSEALLLVAVASHRAGQLEEARRAVREARVLLETFGLRRPLTTLPHEELAAVLRSAGADAEAVLAGTPHPFAGTIDAELLTAQELRVLAALRTTGRRAELASELHLSPNTVKTHLAGIYRKLGVGSRAEALAAAELRGILDQKQQAHSSSAVADGAERAG